MPFSSIAQCDTCSYVTDAYSKLFSVKITIEHPGRNETHTVETMLCPACAEPIVAFQRKIPYGDARSRDEQIKKLNERILNAIKKAE